LSAHSESSARVIILAIVVKRVLGIRVERARAEALRKELTSFRLVDVSRLIVDDGDCVVIPLKSAPAGDLFSRFSASIVESEFPARESPKDPIDQVIECVNIPDSQKRLLPRKWEQFGDIVVLRLDPALDRYELEIARGYSRVLKVKTVLRDVGGIAGDLRQPLVKTLLGTDTVTTHLENGIRFKFDAAKVMFSSGNIEERMRMAELKCDGETVVDMFAGIGYFSIPLAVYQRPGRVIACELNPVAHSYLMENTRLNKVERIVQPFLGDCRTLPGESIADRVIMGYVRITHEFLETAVRLLRSGGIVHYHETCPNELLPDRPIQHLNDGARGCKVDIQRMKEIKSYAPGVSHVVVDVQIIKPA
jgi:tRNA wybutosine-synthesizing protein 2